MITTTKPRRTVANRVAVVAVVLILLPTLVRAEPVEEQNVVTAVQTWVRQVTADARPDAVIERLEPYIVDGRTAAYIAHLADGGYCICGADDRLLPVYLYRPVDTFDPTDPNYRFVLEDIAARLGKLEAAKQKDDPVLQQYEAELTRRRADWGELIAERAPTGPGGEDDRSDPQMMTLPLTSYWKQGSPFNDYCPELTPGADEHTVVGCVATAMAQIMYYWQWPNTGTGSAGVTYHYRYSDPWWWIEPLATDPELHPSWNGRLEWHPDNGGELWMTGYWDESLYETAQDHSTDSAYRNALADLWGQLDSGSTSCSASFSAATYNWSIARDTYSEPPSAGDLEAAEISYHAGLSVGMEYGVKGSSSSTEYAPWAYRTYFDYDPDVVYTGRSTTTMISEIQWFRLVQIRGENDSGGGHSWIAAGYNEGTTPVQFLMNMGWGGGSTDWYSVDEVFEHDQGHAIRIAPESVVRFVDYGYMGGDGTPTNPYLGFSTGYNNAPENTTLIMKAGSTHTLSGSPAVLDRAMTLKGYDVTITLE